MSKKIAIIGTRGYPSSFPGSSGIDTFIEQIIPFLDTNKITIYTRIWVKNKNKFIIFFILIYFLINESK